MAGLRKILKMSGSMKVIIDAGQFIHDNRVTMDSEFTMTQSKEPNK